VTISSQSEAERRSTFEALFEAQYAAVQRAAARRVPEALVDDVVAATFLVAWRRIDDLPESVVPWLHGVVRRVAANERRSSARQAQVAERMSEYVPVAEAVGPSAEREGPVMRAFGELSVRDQEVLALVTWDGLSAPEAAQALGVRPGTLRVRLHRALGRLERRTRHHSTPNACEPSKELVHE
jgi:RNA polymerase sigma-70 factor (ECF subfamily)